MLRTRFAPSPTGYLHIGGARTALFCWLYAQQQQGAFILRIEDTDLERSTQASIDAILEAMDWLGLDYDEGPFYQTQRFDRYREQVQRLLDQGKAYHCYCSKERLEALRTEQMAAKQKPRYDGCCRGRTEPVPDVQPVVRFKNPTEGEVVLNDIIRGQIVVKNSELDDLIIMRPDGSPTYNFCVVVDDLDMAVTHVIRGDDHINNTPRQINIFHALDATPPQFAHVPMILGADGARLSKRHGAVGVMQYRDEGFLPEALLNYLVRLGWSHGDQEIFSRQEMIDFFKLEDVNRAASTFNNEKLLWLNQHYLKITPPEQLTEALQWQLQQLDIDISAGPSLAQVIVAFRDRAKTLREMAEQAAFLFRDFEAYEPTAAAKHLIPAVGPVLNAVHQSLADLSDWQAEPIQTALQATAEELGLKFGKVGPPLRIAVSGGTASPSLDITLQLLGREKTLARIHAAVGSITSV
jgi:glutamyl-tRNA synthetase